MFLKDSQVEYLVVNYKAEDPNVTLSLRQADILHALAHDVELCKDGGCVPDLQDVDQRLDLSLDLPSTSNILQKRCPPNLPSGVRSIYVGSYAWETMGDWIQGSTRC